MIDARLANLHFEPPEKVHLATGPAFSGIEVDEGPAVEVGGVDIADAFYHIELIPELRGYFSLPPVRAQHVGVENINGRNVKNEKVFPCLRVVPMGQSKAAGGRQETCSRARELCAQSVRGQLCGVLAMQRSCWCLG